MSTALQKVDPANQAVGFTFDEPQVQLLKSTICKGASDDELKFFIYACQRTGLDPFAKQIYSVPRAGQRVIQIGVDGYRIIAERTGRYSPGREPTYTYDKNGSLLCATAYVQKQTKDGSWHEVAASAFFTEYDAKNPMWKKMPHLMLAKCAECLCLRKCFPSEMSGTYSDEEMQQSDIEIKICKPKLSIDQVIELQKILVQCDAEYQDTIKSFIKKKYNVEILDDVPAEDYQKIKTAFETKSKEYQKKLAEAEMDNIKKEDEDDK